MLIKAKIGFAGRISMYEGEVAECGNPDVVRDLQRAGYIEIVTPEEPVTPEETVTTDEPVTQDEHVEHEQQPEKPKRGRKKTSKSEAVVANENE